MRLVDPKFLKVLKRKKRPFVCKKSVYKKSKFPFGGIFLITLLFGILYMTWNYVQNAKIENPDLSCLPENVRGNTFFKGMSNKVVSRKFEISPNAHNEDKLQISMRNF